MLVLFDPLHKHVGIEGKHHQIRLPDEVGVGLRRALVDDVLFQGIVNGALLQRDGTDVKTESLEHTGVTAAQQTQAHDEYIFTDVYDHIAFTLAPSFVMSSKK